MNLQDEMIFYKKMYLLYGKVVDLSDYVNFSYQHGTMFSNIHTKLCVKNLLIVHKKQFGEYKLIDKYEFSDELIEMMQNDTFIVT